MSTPNVDNLSAGGDKKPVVKVNKVKNYNAYLQHWEKGYIIRLKRWTLFGCDEIYRSCKRRSINKWFVNDENVRVYKKVFKLHCIRLLSQAISCLSEDSSPEAASVKARLLECIEKTILDNAEYATPGTVSFILGQMKGYANLRPVAASLINRIPLMSTDLMLFNHYAKQTKGSSIVIRKAMIEWYKQHTDDPALLKDLLLKKRRVTWKHADIIKFWHVPAKNNVVIRSLLGFEVDTSVIQDAKKREVVDTCLKLRNLNSKNVFFKLLADENFLDQYGNFALMNVKSQMYCKEVLEYLIKKVPDNDLIESIPRILIAFPNTESVLKQLVERLRPMKVSSAINLLSLYLTMRWIAWRTDQDEVKKPGKIIHKLLQELFERLVVDYHKSNSKVLFIVKWEKIKDFNEAPIKRTRPVSGQRPCIHPNIVRSVEFLALLLHLYPNHRILIQKTHYEIKDCLKVSEIVSKLEEIKEQKTEPLIKTDESFPKAVVFSFDDGIEEELYSKLKAFNVERLVVVCKEKVKTPPKDNPISHKTLIIHGFDLNFLTLIHKSFEIL